MRLDSTFLELNQDVQFMSQQKTVQQFLASANQKITEIEKSLWIDEDTEITEVDQVKLFDTATQLRKCLEAIANDIYESVYGIKHRLVVIPRTGKKDTNAGKFPVGKTKSDFLSRIGSTHPGLAQRHRYLYDLLEGVQPHKLWKSTISELFDVRNEAEHDDFTQTVNPTDQRSYNFGGLVKAENAKNFGMTNFAINGKGIEFRTGLNGKMTKFIGDRSILEVKKRASITVPGSSSDVIEMYKEAARLIDKLQRSVYNVI